jgi:hypothetical protein
LDTEALIAMKTARKRRTRRAQGANATHPVTSPDALAMKLPIQARPVIRGVMRDPISAAIGAAASSCDQCLAACRAHGGPFQSVCESVCAAYCHV